MEYQSLYRRYRPRRFSEMCGQEHVVRALRNAVREDRVAHAYLLSGPRGTGKTTAARILAKALNCPNVVDGEPCCECESCLSIDAGTSFDLHELDAASNNKVDDIRDLLARVALGTPGRTKVYLLDEVHMLTAGAENALLKTLEEPPAHVVFVLATTEPHKVVATIRSRTQHLELGLIPADQLREHLQHVVADAGLDVDEEVIEHVLRVGGGSARDTLSALDQVVAAGGVGHRRDALDELLAALADRDPGAALAAAEAAVARGREPRVIGEELLASLRDVFLVAMGASPARLGERERQQAEQLAARLSPARITAALQVLGTTLVEMRQAPDPRVDLDVALVRMTRDEADVEGLAARVAELESRLAALEAGGAVAAPSSRGSAASGAPAAATAAPPPPPPPRRGARPADGARQKLAERTGTARARTERPPAAAAAPSPAPPPVPPPPAPASRPAPPATGNSTPPPDAAPGSLDHATVEKAWPAVLDRLRKGTRARYAANARLLSVVGDEVTFGMPNDVTRQMCEKVSGEVVEAFAAELGTHVRVKLVVEEAGAPAAHPAPAPVEADEPVDLDELVDAPAEEDGLVARLTSAFPGAELIDNE